MIITNELEPLSNNLDKITTEIKTYQSIGGQAIFEIGRRLNWVKEHDLAHGEFINWLSTLNIDRHVANKFMKIQRELPNGYTGTHLGWKALYEIATMPPEERDKPQQLSNGETKKPEDMTVRELRETKRKLKQRDQELADKDAQIADQQAELEENRRTQVELNRRNAELSKQQPEPKVITKTVTKEVKPDDYEELKNKQAEYERRYDEIANQLAETRNKEKDARNEIRKMAEEQDELERKLEAAGRAVTDGQVKRAKNKAEYSAYRLVDDTDDFIRRHHPLEFQKDGLTNATDTTKERLVASMNELINFANDMMAVINGKQIIEGEMIEND